MHISREISDPELAEFIQDVSEETLANLVADYLADQEIAAAIDYSNAHDDPEKDMGGEEFLASIGRGKSQ